MKQLWERIQQENMWIIGVQDGLDEATGVGSLSNHIIMVKSPSLEKVTNIQRKE